MIYLRPRSQGLVLFDSQKDIVSGKNFGFWQYFGFCGDKLGPKMDQNHQLWVRLVLNT